MPNRFVDSPMLSLLDWILLALVAGVSVAYLLSRRPSPPSASRKAVSGKPPVKAPVVSKDFVSQLKASGKRLIVFYGSQTGTAEEYARRLVKDAARYGIAGMVSDLGDHDDFEPLREMPDGSVAVFVVATYGEGEPTDNAQEFYEWLMSDNRVADDKPFAALNYVMFGLGNKTYEHFNAMARRCDKRLQALGANRIGERGEGDDDGNMEHDFVEWKDGMWTALCAHMGIDPSTLTYKL